MDKTIEFIKKLNIRNDEYIVVACSGGPDSIFLLHLLNKLGYKCVCAHVNHNVREASKDEYKFLENFCINHNVVFEGITIEEYDKKRNFHEFAREFRYKFFQQIIDKYNSHYLFTAHHGDDLMETVLMRLTRGSSIRGYAGFSSVVEKEDYKIVRPLVYLNKFEIEKLDKENDIEYVIDESNETDHYTRNRYRHHVLPALKEENNNVHLKFLSYSEKLYDCIKYVDNIVDGKLNTLFDNNVLKLDLFIKEDLFIQEQIIERILKYNYLDNLYLVDSNTVSEIIKIINNSKPNFIYDLPDNLKAIKEYDRLIFTREIRNHDLYKRELKDSVITDNFIIKKVSNSNDTSNNVIRLNSKDIKLPLYIRNRRSGDTIDGKNCKGSTKIKKVFIDKKLSNVTRDNYPLLIDANDEILWIPGLKKSKKDIEKNGDYDIIIISEKRREENE